MSHWRKRPKTLGFRDVIQIIPEVYVLVVLLLAAAPSGTGSDVTQPKVLLRGAGASFPVAVYEEWVSAYKDKRKGQVDLEMTYTAVGSTSGKKAITGQSDLIVEYGASDYELSAQEKKDYSDLKLLPTMAGAVVFGYNLDLSANESLVLSMELVVGIYNGTYQYWNDSAFHDLNSNISLPHERIIVIARGDSSGTTHTLTTAFSTIDGWRIQYGVFTKGAQWNRNFVTYLARKNRGMSGMLLSFKYSIGYLVVADALDAGLRYAKMSNSFGVVVNPTSKSVQLAMDKAAEVMQSELTVQLANHQQRESYPIASFTYMIVKMSTMPNCVSAAELLRYIHWFTSTDFPRQACSEKHMVPISSSIVNRIEELIMYRLECDGKVLWPSVQKQIEEEEETKPSNEWMLGTIVGLTMLVTIGFTVALYVTVMRIRTNRELDNDEWDIAIEDIVFYTTAKSSTTGNSRFVMWSSVRTLTDIDELEDGYQMVKHILQWPGKWNTQTVGLRLLEVKNLIKVKRETKKLLLSMRDNIIHNNVLNFYGLSELQNDRYVVSDYCSKGSLSDLLKDTKYFFNKDCKLSLSLEILGGLVFLHSKGIFHGNLRTSSCLVDFKWTVKIADWEYCHLYTHMNPKRNPLLALRKTADDVGKDKAAFLEFWTAPEILKSEYNLHPTVSCDIYSYGIILQEIFTRKDPYHEYSDTMEPSELIKAILGNNLRPSHGEETPTSIRQIMEYAWSDVSGSRPSSEQIQKMLRNAHNLKKSVLDHMVEASEEYAVGLEEQLQFKAEQLAEKETQLSELLDSRIPMCLRKKLEAAGSNGTDMTSSVCVIALRVATKAKQLDRRRKSSGSMSKWIEKVDHRLSEIAARYNAFLINYTNGAYIMIYGVGIREKRKALQAAKMALEVISEETDNSIIKITEDTINESASGSSSSSNKPVILPTYRCVIHHGSVYAGLVQGSFPKCHIMGEVVEETYRLLQYAQASKVLVSKSFKEALSIFALDSIRLEVNEKTLCENGVTWPGETYWMYPQPHSDITKWTSLLPSTRGHHQPAKSRGTSLKTRPARTDADELPVQSKLTSLLHERKQRSVRKHADIQATVSLPAPSVDMRSPWGSIGGKLSRSRSFTTGTIATLRHFLRRTLPPAPSYKMNVISSNDERISDDLDLDLEPSLDVLPV